MSVKWPPVPVQPVRIPIDTLHSEEYPFCSDWSCPCHNDEDLQAELGQALADGRVKDCDAGAVYYGEKPMRSRVA